ncbi:MAG: beta-lactamase family protein [Ruminococcaceae bacterium]|nr:beta-lactamase family protein [Oscillospiraceae bacterium]
MKRFIALLAATMLLTGCFSEVQPLQETAEINVTSEAAVVTVQTEQQAAPVISADYAPDMFCDYSAGRVEAPAYDKYIAKADEFLVQEDFQGAVLVAKGEDIIYAAGYGYADEVNGTRCTARDTFEIGSISKQMTAAAILQLCEQGRLSLYDTLHKFFPEYEHGRNITIKNLLQMRSGLYDFLNNAGDFFPADFEEEFLERADAPDQSTPDFPRDFLLEYLYTSPLEGTPDDHYYYCNTNYYLLGLIIEQVTGMTYQQYMSEQIFEPCGMLTANNEFRCTTARGYYADGTTMSMRTSTALGCGSVNASVYDLYQWYMHLLDYNIIENRTLRAMLTPVETYGFGIHYDDGLAYHVGNTDVFNAFAMVDVQDEFIVIALTNSPKNERVASGYAGKLFELYYE